ncbi:MAG: hypothetical protein R6V44_00565 [Paracoccaceae bacterium]
MALFSKPGGEAKAGGGALEASVSMEKPTAAPAIATALDRLDAFEKGAAIAEHDNGLAREEAETDTSPERGLVLESTAAGRMVAEFSDAEKGIETDADALLAHLRANGSATYGAAARATGMGATRAWRAEARLRAAGLVTLGPLGEAMLTEAAAHDAASKEAG